MSARVDDISALSAMKVALVKFADSAQQSISDAESDVRRTLHWLDLEQTPYWNGQIRKRGELVSRCKEALRQKQLFKDSTGGQSSAVDELKALARAEAMLKDAHEKLAATRAHLRKMQRLEMDFRGQMQKLSSTLQLDVVNGIARLTALTATLGDYAQSDAPAQAGSVANPVPSQLPKELPSQLPSQSPVEETGLNQKDSPDLKQEEPTNGTV